jgi:hypothetical protein
MEWVKESDILARAREQVDRAAGILRISSETVLRDAHKNQAWIKKVVLGPD